MGHLSINGTWKYFPLGIYSQVTSFEAVMQIRVGPNLRPIHCIYFLFWDFYFFMYLLTYLLGAASKKKKHISHVTLGSSTLTYSFMRIRRILVGDSLGHQKRCILNTAFRLWVGLPQDASLFCEMPSSCVVPKPASSVQKHPNVKVRLLCMAVRILQGDQSENAHYCALLWRMRSNPDPGLVARTWLVSSLLLTHSGRELEEKRGEDWV